MKYFQQGDVLLFPVTDLPADLKPVKGATLALGEHTGHHHTMYDTITADAPPSFNPYDMGAIDTVKMFEDATGHKYAKVLSPVFLKHQEHKPFKVPVGLYRIDIVKEVDPFSDEIRQVMD